MSQPPDGQLRPVFLTVGTNPARAFGLDAATRARRLAAKAGLDCADTPRDGQSVLLANLDYAWDAAWLKAIAASPGDVLCCHGIPVLAHVPSGLEAGELPETMRTGRLWTGGEGLRAVDCADAEFSNTELRKRERPFVLPLDATDPEPVERAAYDASYKGVTDVLTLYLWRRPAFYLTRWAAELRLTPNTITFIGFLFCLLATWLFWRGDYWLGMAAGLVFMVLDTVDGKLARCTGTSSKWGNIFDHGIDLVHPPFWWVAWALGLVRFGTPIEPVLLSMILAVIIVGYVVQRVIEGIFILRHGMHIHVWQRIDSHFRLITARRNPNMIILFGAMLFSRPDVGLMLVALWTLVSLLFHAVRLAQANARRDRGRVVVSWLA